MPTMPPNRSQFSLNAFLWAAFAIAAAVGMLSLNVAEYVRCPQGPEILQVFSKFIIRWVILAAISGDVALCADKKKEREREIRAIAIVLTIFASIACVANYLIGALHIGF